ncbi:hypothetical protein, variant [Capsaspora owczarzaki ATCC 30864]|uniref:hypothetical protein, variant n=1 Tax=Capsaspora owczarzaki (strain ATCC 30864) TaxID=595528 RepID=UPI0003520B44|nr:hypothetical protein, variant [Capsaspora owczarzaki ATCC 30864]|eukprot:XP_011270486.1 hypothetical protein, variant [Capsaspora owczarzaki ATCC 30864]
MDSRELVAACQLAEGSAFGTIALRPEPTAQSNTSVASAGMAMDGDNSFATLLQSEPSLFGSQPAAAVAPPQHLTAAAAAAPPASQTPRSASSQTRHRRREGLERVKRQLRLCTSSEQMIEMLDGAVGSLASVLKAVASACNELDMEHLKVAAVCHVIRKLDADLGEEAKGVLDALHHVVNAVTKPWSPTALAVLVHMVVALKGGDTSPKSNYPAVQSLLPRRRSYASLDLLPTLISAVLKVPWISCDSPEVTGLTMNAAKGMAGAEFKSLIVNQICSCRWDDMAVTPLVATFRRLPLTEEELHFFVEKVIRRLKEIALIELPALVYQLLVLSMKGEKLFILKGIAEHMDSLHRSRFGSKSRPVHQEEEDAEGIQSVSSTPENVIATDGTVLLHLSYAIRQDQELGKAYLKHLKSCDWTALTLFNTTLLFTMANIEAFQEQVYEFLKRRLLDWYIDQETQKKAPWLQDPSLQENDLEDVVMASLRHCHSASDAAVESIVRWGFALLDHYGPKAANTKASTSSHAMFISRLASKLLLEAFKIHSAARPDIVEFLLARVVVKSRSSVTFNVDLLQTIMSTAPQSVLEHVSKIHDALDYLSYMCPAAAEGLLLAIQPLMALNRALQDSVMLILRKSLFSRDSDSREIAVTGFLQILRAAGERAVVMQSRQAHAMVASSQAFATGSASFGAAHDHVSICFEIIGTVRRCLTQQSSVRLRLYNGLATVVASNVVGKSEILDLLHHQLAGYLPNDNTSRAPLRLNRCIETSGAGDVAMSEPIGALLLATLQSHQACKAELSHRKAAAALDDESQNATLHVINSSIDTMLHQILNSTLEDWGLDSAAEFSRNSIAGARNLLTAELLQQIYESLIEHFVRLPQLTSDTCVKLDRLSKLHASVGALMANGAKGKSGAARSKGPAQPAASALSTEAISRLAHILFDTTVPAPQADVTRLRSTNDYLRRFSMSLCVQYLQQAQANPMAFAGAAKYDTLIDMTRIMIALMVHHAAAEGGESDRTMMNGAALCVDLALDLVLREFPDQFSEFLSVLNVPRFGGNVTAGKDDTDGRIHGCIRHYLRVIASFLTSDNPANKQIAELVQIVTKLAGKLLPNSARGQHCLEWVLNTFSSHHLEDSNVTKAVTTQLLTLARQQTQYLPQLPQVCEAIAAVLGMRNNDVTPSVSPSGAESEFAAVHAGTAQHVLNATLAFLNDLFDDFEWLVDKLTVQLVNDGLAASNHRSNNPEGEQAVAYKPRLEQLHAVVSTAVKAVSTLSQMSLTNVAAEAVFKSVNRLFVFLTNLVKHHLRVKTVLHINPAGSFADLAILTGSFSENVYGLITFVEQEGAEQDVGSKKGSSNKARIGRESRVIPNTIYSIEQFERFLIQLSKKASINYMRTHKRSTTRDFRILHKELETAVREQEEAVEDSKQTRKSSKRPNEEAGDDSLENQTLNNLGLGSMLPQAPISSGNRVAKQMRMME